MGATFPYLLELVDESTTGLGDITRRRMFGCDALFTREQIFVLLWRTGRIGVRLPDPAAYAELLALPGSEPWTIREKTMSHWVLVPEDLHDDVSALTPWIRRAHALAWSGKSATKSTRRAVKSGEPPTARPTKPTASPRRPRGA